MNLRKAFIATVAVCFAAGLVALGGCGSSLNDADVAAKGDTVTVTEEEINDYTEQYRAQNDLTDDGNWATYLVGQSMGTSDWRDQTIRTLAIKQLVENKADELGITADDEMVEESLQAQRSKCESTKAWKKWLKSIGHTEKEYRAQLEFANIEEQVLQHELKLSSKATAKAANSYIKTSLADRITRSYCVISFETKKEAKTALAELEKLSGTELVTRYNQLMEEQAKTFEDVYSGEMGWDLSYSTESFIEGDDNLKLQKNSLYKRIVKNDGAYQLYLCTGVFTFEPDITYSDITDSTLKKTIDSLTLNSTLNTKVQNYLDKLIDADNVQVKEMPDDVPYSIADIVSSE